MNLSSYRDQFLVLFSDCVPVRGVRRSAIYDLGRHEVHLFPTQFHELLPWMTSRTIGEVLDELTDPDGSEAAGAGALHDFVQYLLDHELMQRVEDPTSFPPLRTDWDLPGEIDNAIIDVAQERHDFASILSQLDLLGCQYLQVRGFSTLLGLALCREILTHAAHTSIAGVEVIMRHTEGLPYDAYVKLAESERLLTSLTVHSAPTSQRVPLRLPLAAPDAEPQAVTFTRQRIDSEAHCGVIVPAFLNAPTVRGFAEARASNGCLNRKVSVDSRGLIRNCPSMQSSYGPASRTPLAEVVHQPAFTAAWKIRKDLIDVCRGCEFRYICSDCRAYVQEPANPTSKPLKCGYDPATATWQEGATPGFAHRVRSDLL